MSYWDSSALVKLYLHESDSAVFEALAAQPGPMRTCPLGEFESLLTIRHHEAARRLTGQQADQLIEDLLFDVETGVVEVVAPDLKVYSEFQHVVQTCLKRPQPISIRTLDALHLAAALSVSETEFVSHDHRQRAAAAALGMSVLP